MKKRYSLLYNSVIFIIAQLFWLMLLGLWIYWYVSNYIIFKQVGDKIAPQIIQGGKNVFILVGGIILLVGISLIMFLIFRHLNVQLKLTKMYDNFIANITHELKSPLSSIQLYLETLSARKVPDEKQKEFIKSMIKDSNRLKNLINSILEISALEQKKVTHNFQILNAEKTMRNLAIESADQFNLPEGAVRFNGSADCMCVFDYDAMKIVIDNLIDNACKYSNSSPSISIEISCNSNKFIMSIIDNGIGIPLYEQKKIFSKFYRIYNNNIPSVKGTGLGLYWVQEIIKSHGGKISAFSEGPGKGSEFRIELPVYLSAKNKFLKKLLKSTKERKMMKEPADA